nr:hypothetical protein [Actinomyces mediterranea]
MVLAALAMMAASFASVLALPGVKSAKLAILANQARVLRLKILPLTVARL